MATFTITALNTNIDSLASKAGGDTYNINGGQLVIDQDSRYGLNQSTSSTLPTLTISATLGGEIFVDATAVRMIPFTGGSGNVPASNTIITQSGQTGSGKLIGVYSALNVAPTAAASAMPASGYIKIKQVTGTFAAGALTGITATASGPDVVGWIELCGDDAGTISVPRLGKFKARGAWFDLGTTSGTAATTYQMPTNGGIFYCPGVWVETGTGTDQYQFYPCAGSLVAASSVGTDEVRGRVCWISTAGLLRLGSDGTNTVGYCPPAGRKIRVPNIFTSCNTTAARTANVVPNATLATRYDFTTTAGVIDIDKMNLCWYPSFAQSYSVTLSYVGVMSQLYVTELATYATWNQVGVGQEAATAQFGLLMTYCFAGGSITDCTWSSASLAASGRYVVSLQDIDGFDFTRDRSFSFLLRANATTGNAALTRVANCRWLVSNTALGGQILMTTCTNLKFVGQRYADTIAQGGTTGTSNPMSVWVVATNCLNIEMSGLDFCGLTNNHPYTAILSINAAGCNKIKLRNIGTYASKLSVGTANIMGTPVAIASSAAAQNIKIQRVYLTGNARTNILSADNSSKNVLYESFYCDYAEAPVTATLKTIMRQMGMVHAMTAQTNPVYDSTWFDGHTSTTAGRIGLLMNEDTTGLVVTLTGGASFTGQGGLYMPVIGMTATFETPYYILGHTGFQNSAAIMASGTATNYNYNFAIDKNDGNGWSTMTTNNYTATTLATALNALTGIDASKGFKLRIKITTSTTNSTAITSLYFLTTSTTTSQTYEYPLDTCTVQVSGLVTGSRVKASKVSDGTVLFNGSESGGLVSFDTDYTSPIAIEARKASAAPYYQPWVTQLTPVADVITSAIALQVRDDQ